ncbi:FAD-binding protein [Pseudomarimonas arenosa]|uniref:FAD-binding oxidoreductase n=1 Tax=Pseudomarimonas arenosa TaxID=2774145 RepID=A0AAW3ZKI3_9GAMM|nr:FAD-binding oxidoreductase [Pseudomarimonas arenosa]MBD8526468.1 FAD-binding oxidoreductase [Pseudomarimonas arenosa]
MDNQSNERNRFRNDLHSGMNVTRHARVFVPETAEAVADVLQEARRAGKNVAVAGAQNAMGGQQFLGDGWLMDTRRLNGVLDFDREQGLLQVAAGTRWPQVQRFLSARFDAEGFGWSIRQKQTGADDFSLGGSLASNIHGRGLDSAPLVADIENFNLVMADGFTLLVDRQREPDLFSLAVGGYGMFGVVSDLTLRLRPRTTLKRNVQMLRRHELSASFAQARAQGAEFGDFQFAIDPASKDFLNLGVFASYQPTRALTPRAASAQASSQSSLSAEQWRELLWLAHCNKSEAFRRYSEFYLNSDGQHYTSDEHQFGVYLEGYHQEIDERLGYKGSDTICELYVPLDDLDAFLGELAETCRQRAIDVVYGTVRVIRRDAETVLAWARQDWACVVLNLHVRHDDQGFRQLQLDMQQLYDLALTRGGSFYLTYGLHARADQLRQAYPDIDHWIRAKQLFDPHAVLQSNWYRRLCSKLGHSIEAESVSRMHYG